MLPKTEGRRLPWVLLSLALVLCLMRFAHLRADFPNHSPWIMDESKYTDEGWWASAAVRHFLIGHWHIAGDYNPAAVVPVWPFLLTMVFHFTGVNIVAARALNVSFSIATVILVYLSVQRFGGARTTAALAALLLAASPFAFAFSRLATLDSLIVFEWALLMWTASYAAPGRMWPAPVLGALLSIMILTKTTSLVLLPAVLWVLWKKAPRMILPVGAIAAASIGSYFSLLLRSSYAVDLHYFFDINALAEVDWQLTGSFLRQLFHHGFWIDRILYPAGLAALLLSLVWLRGLWKNPLFAASWIALAGNAVYILRRQDDYAPRYFLVMLAPLILVLVLTLEELGVRNRCLASLLAAALAGAVVLDAVQLTGFLHHREYQFYDAAQAIRAIVDTDRTQPRLLLGTSGDQLSLMAGIPSINDGYSSQDLSEKVAAYRPGWYVGWNDLDQDILNSLSAFRLDEVANFAVFDGDQRNRLKLYRMVLVKEARQ